MLIQVAFEYAAFKKPFTVYVSNIILHNIKIIISVYIRALSIIAFNIDSDVKH